MRVWLTVRLACGVVLLYETPTALVLGALWPTHTRWLLAWRWTPSFSGRLFIANAVAPTQVVVGPLLGLGPANGRHDGHTAGTATGTRVDVYGYFANCYLRVGAGACSH